ncbi:MAG: M48 family metallopeptidase [Chitinophagales bacterium]
MNNLIHPKETAYKSIMYIISGIIWIPLIIFAVIGFVFSIPFIFISWLSSLYYKAQILGDCVKVNNNQYPEIYNIVTEYSNKSGLIDIPEVYVYNSNGLLNAFAIKLFMNRFIMLTSSIVDISYKNTNHDELNFIIGHEIGHHAAGHTNILKSIFITPSKFIPFLGAAYSRACELTADRYGMYLSGNLNASVNSLVNLAHGSKVLSHKTNIDSFISQENEIPELMGFVSKLFSTHPRLTRRVIELNAFSHINNNQFDKTDDFKGIKTTSDESTQFQTTIYTPHLYVKTDEENNTNKYIPPIIKSSNCPKCNHPLLDGDAFCENCGNKLK